MNDKELDLEIMAVFGADQLEQKRRKFNDDKKQLQFKIVQSLLKQAELRGAIKELMQGKRSIYVNNRINELKSQMEKEG